MKTAVKKWGNSLAVRIPRALAMEARLGNGTEVDLQLKSSTLVISSARKGRYRLRELLAQVMKTNLHSEAKWGEAAGREI